MNELQRVLTDINANIMSLVEAIKLINKRLDALDDVSNTRRRIRKLSRRESEPYKD